VVVLAVIAAAIFGGGWWVQAKVEQRLAAYIEHRVPGSVARVDVNSFPFLGHLVVSGTVADVSVHLSRLSAGPINFNGVEVSSITFNDVDIHVHDVQLNRSQLLHRRVIIDRIRDATVTAIVRQEALDRSVGLPVTLGKGTVGIGGLALPASIAVQARQVTITVPQLLTVSLPTPALSVLPCLGRVVIAPGALLVSCSLHRLPPVLSGTSFSF
ncbi:MAG: hypothetical protein J2O38_07535, partial [Acidimicrobiales bacterium]|nr:hypothetical protein [Acidimicrobiales bacterium]